MTLECPKCKSPVARDGQRFCYRCGHDLGAYYESLKLKSEKSGAVDIDVAGAALLQVSPPRELPAGTVILDPNAFDGEKAADAQPKANLKILLPTGDAFDREINEEETQIGKGPRNDLVIADPSVSTAHSVLRREKEAYTIADLGSRNGTFVNGERVTSPRRLTHGDVIGMGLSKLTFRLADYSETGSIDLDELTAASKNVGPPPLTEDSLASAVISAGLVSQADLDRARKTGKDRRLVRAIVEERLASEEKIRDLMSRTFEIPVTDLETAQLDESVIAEFSPRLALERNIIAVAREGSSLVIAVSDPTDSDAIQDVRNQVQPPVILRLATASQIREHVNRLYGPKLIGVLPTGEKLEYPVDKHEVEIGKASHNQIVLTDQTVSNTHAIVIAREGGYSIVDLGSRNGTFVNGERLGSKARTLRHGEKIQLGKTVLTFRNPGETAANVTAVLSEEALKEVRRRSGVMDLGLEENAAPNSKPASGDSKPDTPGSEALTPAGDDDKDEKKKKKKKKKKDKDARLRAAYVSAGGRIFAAILSVALTVVLTLYLFRQGQDKSAIKVSTKGHAKLKADKLSSATPFKEGALGTSGVVQVPGADMVLMVDDSKLDVILAMGVDSSGQQAGPIKSIPLGASIADMEGIAYGDGYFYVTGSQGDPKGGDQNAIARFKFDPAGQTIQGTQVIPNLRQFLLENVSELKGQGDAKGKEGGLNIEGLAWDPRTDVKRLLLGLRSPQLNGQALIVAIKLIDPSGPFSMDNLQLAEPRAIQLELEGLGIRDIQYDIRLQAFLVIAGAPAHGETKLGFKLWEWSGDTSPSDSKLQKVSDLDTAMHPEGVTHLVLGGREFIFIVGDGGGYTKLDYAEAE
jgi:pSer/pThr/pTyr-binding forkhead associated (FHA) protein